MAPEEMQYSDVDNVQCLFFTKAKKAGHTQSFGREDGENSTQSLAGIEPMRKVRGFMICPRSNKKSLNELGIEPISSNSQTSILTKRLPHLP